MRIHFLGANRQVTGSRHVLEVGDTMVMVDCGLFQERACQARNWAESPIEPARVDAMLLTHGHLDHCGLIPKFVREGFAGPIHATPPSIELAEIVLEDAGRIQEEDAAYKKRRHEREERQGPHPEIPLYTAEEAKAVFGRFRPVLYDRPLTINEHVEVVYRDAGHILGSALLEVTVRDHGQTRRVVFSGDLGQRRRALMHDPTFVSDADYVVMESTYGGRRHEPAADLCERLAAIINDAVARGGNVIIPTFAIDRAQEILYHLSDLVNEQRIPRLTIFVDSPMAISATDVYKRHKRLLDDATQRMFDEGRHPFQFAGLHFVRTSAESKSINSIRGSCIILAGSGMCTGGRVKHHLRHNIERPESTVLFVGYQAEGTLGRRILERDPRVRIHGREYEVRARIEKLNGLSAHGDHEDLMAWISHVRTPLKGVFLTHGELGAAQKLAAAIEEQLGCPVHVPEYQQVLPLD